MGTKKDSPSSHNVFDIFSGLRLADPAQRQRVIRLSPEHDGISMLYSNHTGPDKLYRMKLLCWALREDGSVDGVVPWFDGPRCCEDMDDQDLGMWEGYYEPSGDEIFFEPPPHKVGELQAAARFFSRHAPATGDCIQEIADTIGTHALFIDPQREEATLTEVVSWRLDADGRFHAMLIDQDKVTSTPVLPGDPCLYAADGDPAFHYFFQHDLANQIKCEEPEAMAAVALLLKRY